MAAATILTWQTRQSNDFNQRQEVERILAVHASLAPVQLPDASGNVQLEQLQSTLEQQLLAEQAAHDSAASSSSGSGSGSSATTSIGAAQLNPIDVLDLPLSVYITCAIEDRLVKTQYRKRSLLVHPDKCSHARAQEAFDLLKKAENTIMDPAKRKRLLGFLIDARAAVFMAKGVRPPKIQTPAGPKLALDAPESAASAAAAAAGMPVTAEAIDAAALEAQFPGLGKEIQTETRKLLFDLVNRDRIRLKNDMERKLAQAERDTAERKRKMEHQKTWEESREERVGNWRKFQQGVGKKKRKKDELPGALPFDPSLLAKKK
ncbi:hypothetical protein BC831DRAFT_469513 [Entophlyctis helioformis]|nr:hypothetical protein BC831DRAFT_469513 [Entophlyctis helioformis]